MGVKTKDWGPHGWVVIESLGRLYDDILLQIPEKDETARHALQQTLKSIIFLIGFILPCVYCRISYRKFTNPQNLEIDIDKKLLLENGGKHVVYEIHRKVSEKLEEQESNNNPSRSSHIERKWRKLKPSFRKVLKSRFWSVTSEKFWQAYVKFLAYIMCDYRSDDHAKIYLFIYMVGKLLTLSPDLEVSILSHQYQKAWINIQRSGIGAETLEEHIDTIWSIPVFMIRENNWDFDFTPESFQDMCSSSIVNGCDKV
jgi:hypothetical protein